MYVGDINSHFQDSFWRHSPLHDCVTNKNVHFLKAVIEVLELTHSVFCMSYPFDVTLNYYEESLDVHAFLIFLWSVVRWKSYSATC